MQQTTDHQFHLAPIRGITDALFRDIYHRHFPYFNRAVAPFINPQRYANFKDSLLKDILPENNGSLPVTPQLLYNSAEDFIKLGKRLEELGYSEINWNLGCPAPQVANKQRGSGLLPHPDRITEILDGVHAELKAKISIKTRLGFKSAEDLEVLLPKLERFPLKEIIIHPRIGKQLYRGVADLDSFGKCRSLTSHRLVYNGDIRTSQDYNNLATKFPDISRWMIGRGALADPFMLADIHKIVFSAEQKKEKLRLFHDEVYEQSRERLHGPGHLLNRMKQIWTYLISSFPGEEKSLKKIRKSSTEARYLQVIDELFDD